jgi:D-lactate dehydrogenase (cytochrome)
MREEDLLISLAQIVGQSGVLSGDVEKQPYLEDWWGRNRGSALGVIRPKSTSEVASVVALCQQHGVAMYPQGGNTSVCGGAVPPAESTGIVVNLARMDAIIDLNPRDNSITVQAGCILGRLQEAAHSADRLFPLGLGAEGSCQIGGNISTNAGGTAVLRYGNMRDLVLGLEVVLPDGRIWNGLRTLRKNNSGYDLKNVFIGAEGTLGIVTAASLKLFPRPPNAITALVAIPELEEALTIGLDLGGIFSAELTALELISQTEMILVAKHIPGTCCPIASESNWYLLVELASFSSCEILADRLGEYVGPKLSSGIARDAIFAMSGAQRQSLWRIRHSVTEANKKEGMGLSHDIAVPIFEVATFVRRSGEAIGRAYPRAQIVVVGHVGDGNLHYIVMFDHANWDSLADKEGTRHAVGHIVYDIAVELGGTFSAEHGIGALHLPEMQRYKNPVELDLMMQFKRLLDPANLMNPGRVLP